MPKSRPAIARQAPLLALLFLLAGCIAHVKTEIYVAPKPQQVFAGNKTIIVRIIPTEKLTRHVTLPERLASAAFFHAIDTGPYSLGIMVRTTGIENGVSVEVNSAELRFSSGLTREVLSKNSPSLKGVTQQQEKQDRYRERADFSRCDFSISLGDQLIFKANERLHVLVTVKIAGLPEEKLDGEFLATGDEHWGSTWSLL